MGPLIRFMLPVLGALFLQALYGGVDLLIVGQFGQTADVSGVGTGSLLTGTLTQIIAGLAMGVTVLVGEHIGAGEPEEAGKDIGSGICLFAVFAVILTAVMAIGADGIASLLQAPEESFSQTSAYIRICGVGAVFIVAYNLIGAIFRGLGDSRTPLMTVAIACVCNIIGDLILVAGLQMGAAGAAVATVAAQAISVVISLVLISRKDLPFTFHRNQIRFDRAIIGKELKLGAPLALQDLCVSASFLYVQAVVNTFGVTASAGVGVAEKVCQFVMLVPSAIMQSLSAFVAQNMGAAKPERAKRALKISVPSSFGIGVLMFCAMFFGGSVLSSIFSNDPDVIAASHAYLKAYGLDSLICPMMFCFLGYFNGCEQTVFVMVQGLIGALLVRTPVVWMISRLENATLFMVGLGTPASSVVQLILCVCFYVWLARKQKKDSPAYG